MNITSAQRVPSTGVAQTSSLDRNHGIVQRLRETFRRWQENARIHGELTHMSSRELADLGLSHSDIPDVVRGTYNRG